MDGLTRTIDMKKNAMSRNKWRCYKKMGGYLLEVYNHKNSISMIIDYYTWDHCTNQSEYFKMCIEEMKCAMIRGKKECLKF